MDSRIATLAGGCFWCLEAVFERLKGVQQVVSGYTGGDDARADYPSVCTGSTGHAEAIQITFDPGTLGLSRHEVYLTADEAIFVFAGPGARAAVQRASRDPSLWRVGLAWSDCIGGRPRLADAAEAGRRQGLEPEYSWTAERL